jgi:hypothetical protein
MRKYVKLLCLMALAACDGLDEVHEVDKGQFEVTVISVQLCNYVTIEFKEEDAAAVQQITDAEGTTYHALNLNKLLVHPGQKLLIEIRKMNENEWIDCPSFVATYPGVVLLSLKITS